ncbi:hypothetical protein [Parasediminibacterium sp. JCM 36343]|uniref:hypothetical protein n=1 Tax=Parasediminibacterium sp. JCM 36343 TaxID=3374279 RepID=UPI00397BB2A0
MKKERLLAASLYINSTLTQEEVAGIINVPVKTIARWALADKWKLQRIARQVTADKIIANYYTIIADIQAQALDENRQLTPMEVNNLHKMAASIDKLNSKLSIGNYYKILNEFASELMQYDIEAAKILGKHMMEFLNRKGKQLEP